MRPANGPALTAAINAVYTIASSAREHLTIQHDRKNMSRDRNDVAAADALDARFKR